MKTKNVVQLDYNGYYVGLTVADECPLEEGVWLMPAGTIEAPIPPLNEGMCYKWTGSSWSEEKDWRGTWYWTPDGNMHQIAKRGDVPPSDALFNPPVGEEGVS